MNMTTWGKSCPQLKVRQFTCVSIMSVTMQYFCAFTLVAGKFVSKSDALVIGN